MEIQTKKCNMPNSSSIRETILNDLQAVNFKSNHTYESISSTQEYFVQPKQPLAESFKTILEAISGNCSLCNSIEDALNEIKSIIGSEQLFCNNQELISMLTNNVIAFNNDNEFARTAKFSLTTCEALSTRTASVIVSSKQMEGRRAIAAAENHIVLAYENQLHEDLPQALAVIENKFGKNFPSQIFK